MKFTKQLTALFVALFALPTLVQAADLTCAEIQKAGAEGTIARQEFATAMRNPQALKVQLLRKALVIYGSLTQAEADQAKVSALYKEFEPIFRTLLIGDKEFQVVDIGLGDNPFVFLFEKDNGVFSGIRSDDGSVSVDGVYCDTESDLF